MEEWNSKSAIVDSIASTTFEIKSEIKKLLIFFRLPSGKYCPYPPNGRDLASYVLCMVVSEAFETPCKSFYLLRIRSCYQVILFLI